MSGARQSVESCRLADELTLVVDAHQRWHEGLAQCCEFLRRGALLFERLLRSVANRSLEGGERSIAKRFVVRDPEYAARSKTVIEPAQNERHKWQCVGSFRVAHQGRNKRLFDRQRTDARRSRNNQSEPLDRHGLERKFLES